MALLSRVAIESEAGQAYSAPYLFGLLVPSEALKLARDLRGGRISEFNPHAEITLIATSFY